MEKAIEMPQIRLAALDSIDTGEKSSVIAPRIFGEYQILEVLGRGGMGRVYKALHMKLDRIAAIKILPRGRLGDPQAATRFTREMKAVGRLNHPNIVQAYDAREIDDTPVLVMEFVDGLDLSELLRRTGSLPVAEACALARETAIALQCAHEHGLVHRDVKPSNIMLSRAGEVKLLDLGLARFYADSPSGEEMTGAGQVMGTADYIAPEQANDCRTVDIRADLYSLGCTLYKLLCGHAPFSGQNYRGTLDKMNAHMSHTPPPITQYASSVPAELAAIVAKLMAKNPDDRYATPAEVAVVLEPFCAGANLVELEKRAADLPESQWHEEQRAAKAERSRGSTAPAASATSLSSRRLQKVIGVVSIAGIFMLAVAMAFYWGWSKGGKPVVEQAESGTPFAAQVGGAGEPDDGMRTWTDATGKHRILAKFDSFEDEKVILIRKNGEKTSVAAGNLSKQDRDYLTGLNADNPFQKIEQTSLEKMLDSGPEKEIAAEKEITTKKENTSVAKAGRNAKTDKSSDNSKDLPPTVKIDWSQSQAVSLIPDASEWKVTLPEVSQPEIHAKSTPLPAKLDFFERVSGMAVSSDGRWAVVGYQLDHPSEASNSVFGDESEEGSGATGARIRLALCDLEKGRVTTTVSTRANMTPLAMHEDGKHVLMHRNERGFGKTDRLELWSIEEKNIVRSQAWTPYEDGRSARHEVTWAAFLGAKQLATCNHEGKIVLWNSETCQPICHFHLSDRTIPALSPDRKRIAFATSDTVGIFDVGKREVVASQKTPQRLSWPSVAFSPSGKRIACASNDRIFVWDVAKGHLEKSIALTGCHGTGGIDFPDDNFVLLNHQLLVDLESRIKVWNYLGGEHTCTLGGITFFAESGEGEYGSGMLIAAKLPHAEARNLLKKATSEPDFFPFHKGMAVKLDVSKIPDEIQKKNITDILTKKLGELNCTVTDNGTAEIAALVEGPTMREVFVSNVGTYDMQEFTTKLQISARGKTLWESQGTNIPSFATTSRQPWGMPPTPGMMFGNRVSVQDLEKQLREAAKQPAYKWFETVDLPEYLQMPAAGQTKPNQGSCQTLGQSFVTPRGL
jgi:serine/threonine protein kinase/WD40 repeat protein